MENISKSEHNKRNYKRHAPYPVRLGDLKPRLAEDAFEMEKSIHYLIKKILKEYYEKKEKAA